MKVVTTFHHPSSVSHSLRCSLSSNKSLQHLIVVKLNTLEVYSAQPEGLRYECAYEVYGRISAIRSLTKKDEQHNVLLLTDHPAPKLVVLSPEWKGDQLSLISIQTEDLREQIARPSEFVHSVYVDPYGLYGLAHCYTGKAKAFTIKEGRLEDFCDVMVPELNILSLALVSSPPEAIDTPGPTALAILFLDHRQSLQLLLRDLNLSEYELSPSPSLMFTPTIISTKAFEAAPIPENPPIVVSVPPLVLSNPESADGQSDFNGGLLVVGGKRLLLYELTSKESQKKHSKKLRKQLEGNRSSTGKDKARSDVKDHKDSGKTRSKAAASIAWPWSEVTACCQANEDGTRYLLGDSYGRLAMLCLDSLYDQGLILIPLGETSPATTLSYLNAQFVYVGSHFGDSQLVKIHRQPYANVEHDTLPLLDIFPTDPSSLISSSKGKGKAAPGRKNDGRILGMKGKYLEVVHSWRNIGPILDAVKADTDGSGLPHIVTCSGGKNTGSLRVIRNGADFQEKATIDGLENMTGLWTLSAHNSNRYHAYIAASDKEETYLFRIEGPDTLRRMESSSDSAFRMNKPSLAIANVGDESSSLVLQVMSDKVQLLEHDSVLETFHRVKDWQPDREIEVVSISSKYALVGLSDGKVNLLSLEATPMMLKVLGSRPFNGDISALCCTPQFDIGAIGFWNSDRLELVSLVPSPSNPLSTRASVNMGVSARAHSILLHKFDPTSNEMQLLVGLTNGTLLAYTVSPVDRKAPGLVLRDRKIFTLGSMPVKVMNITVDGQSTLLAAGSRSAVFFWERNRLKSSPVMLNNIFASAPLHTQWSPLSLVLATGFRIIVGSVHGLDKMHISTVTATSFGLDNPRRIVHDPHAKVFAVACTRIQQAPVYGEEYSKSSLKLLDDSTFDLVGEVPFGEGNDQIQEITAIHTFVDEGTSFYCVGLVNYQLDEREPSHGELYIFQKGPVNTQAKVDLLEVAKEAVAGCVYALASYSGYIVAAVNSAVTFFKLDTSTSDPILEKAHDWNHNYVVTSLVANEHHILVGDAISSISVLCIVHEDDSRGGFVEKIKTVARDYGPLWPVSLQSWGNDGVIGANSDCNLFSFTLQNQAGEKMILERDGHFHLDDHVNKFVQGTAHSSEKAEDLAIEAKSLFFTSSGRIGVILDMDKELSLHMTALQRNLNSVVKEMGGTTHRRWRAPVSGRGQSDADAEAYGFLDGNFIEQFLNYDESSPEMKRIMEGNSEPEKLKMSHRELVHVLETLMGMH